MTTAPARRWAASITAGLEALADPAAAAPMRAYMRDQFTFYGVKTPDRVALCRQVAAEVGPLHEVDLDSLARWAWARPQREHQYAATWFLRRHVRLLSSDFIHSAGWLITHKSWWDTVDELAQNVVGPLVLADPALVAVMDDWLGSDDLWLARSALLHQNRWKERTDADRLFRYCLTRAGDTEFFVRKAIGWALRTYAAVDADAVDRFVTDHAGELSGLSQREARKGIDRARRR